MFGSVAFEEEQTESAANLLKSVSDDDRPIEKLQTDTRRLRGAPGPR